ncbi:MAG TPA: acyltransferase [Rhodopila sp.]
MLYSIHFLRFIAAAAVVLHHTSTGLGGTVMVGAAGVDVFFVISGIVIGLSTKPGETATAFGVKRFIRVVPLYWVASLAYIGFRFWAWHLVPDAKALAVSAILLPGVDPLLKPIYYPAWTLGYELLFYGLYAILLKAAVRNTNQAAMLAMAFVAAVPIPLPWRPDTPFLSEFCLEFVFGLLVCEALKRNLRLDPRFGAVCLAGAAAAFLINDRAVASRILGWGVPALMLVTGFLAFEGARIFRHPVCVLAGSASYSIYLTHITAIELTSEILKQHGVAVDAHKLAVGALEVCVALVAGVLAHLLVEKPLIAALRATRQTIAARLARRRAFAG